MANVTFLGRGLAHFLQIRRGRPPPPLRGEGAPPVVSKAPQRPYIAARCLDLEPCKGLRPFEPQNRRAHPSNPQDHVRDHDAQARQRRRSAARYQPFSGAIMTGLVNPIPRAIRHEA